MNIFEHITETKNLTVLGMSPDFSFHKQIVTAPRQKKTQIVTANNRKLYELKFT